MIKFFSTGYFSRYIVLLLLSLLLWMPSLLFPSSYTSIQSYAFDKIELLCNGSVFFQTLLAFFLTLITAFGINKIAIDNGFTNKVSTIVAFLYILLSSTFINEVHNNPIIWINFISIFIFGSIYRLSNTVNIIPAIFNASFFLGVASLFYPQTVFLIGFIWLAIFVNRLVTWQNLFIVIIGALLPYVFLITWFYFTDKMLEDSFVLFNSLRINISPIYLKSPIEIAIYILITISVLVSATGVVSSLNSKSINLRNNLSLTIYYMVIVFLILIIYSKSMVTLQLLSLPIAIIVGYWFVSLKKQKWYNIMLAVLLLLIFINQYLYLFTKVW